MFSNIPDTANHSANRIYFSCQRYPFVNEGPCLTNIEIGGFDAVFFKILNEMFNKMAADTLGVLEACLSLRA